MTYNNKYICLHCSLFLLFMLLFQVGKAQYDFKPVGLWVDSNLQDLGGRAVLMVYKDGKIIFSESKNELSERQKLARKRVGKMLNKDPETIIKDYSENSKIAIASCSKWLSAALVMTFVDEGN